MWLQNINSTASIKNNYSYNIEVIKVIGKVSNNWEFLYL